MNMCRSGVYYTYKFGCALSQSVSISPTNTETLPLSHTQTHTAISSTQPCIIDRISRHIAGSVCLQETEEVTG